MTSHKKAETVSFLVNEPKNFFNIIDKDHDNQINQFELKEALMNANIPVTQKLIDTIFKECDTDNNSLISEAEFIKFCENQDKRLRSIFDSIDQNRNGVIERKDLHQSLKSFDFTLKDQEIDDLITKIDTDNDNQISYQEFIQFYHLIPVNNIRNAFNFWIKDTPVIDDLTVVPSKKNCSPNVIMIAGGLAGAISRTATAPLDRLQILCQVSQGNLGLLQSFVNIYKQGGIKGYFKGNGTNVVKIVPETAIKFLLFDYFKQIKISSNSKNETLNKLVSGALAGLTSQTLVYPFSSVKTRLALADKSVYKGMIDCSIKMVQKEGVKSLYKGWTASSIGVIPYASIDLTLFNFLKEQYIIKVGKDPSSLVVLCVGGMSGIVAQTATYPLALVRTRLQSQGMPGREKLYNGLVDCFGKTIRKEGFFGLYRGIVPNMMKSVPAISLSYGIYEKMTQILSKY